MKFIKTLMILTILSVTAHASEISTLKCSLVKIPGENFSFKMKNLGQDNMTFLNEDPDDDYSSVFTTQSNDETIVRMVDTLNGQGGDLRLQKDRIEFFGDADGIDFVYLDLYRKNNYTQGFVRLAFDEGNEKSYSKVTCEIKK